MFWQVEDILSGDSDSESDGEGGLAGGGAGEGGSSSEDSLTGLSRGHKRKLDTIQVPCHQPGKYFTGIKKIFFQEDEKDEEEDSLSQEAAPGTKFRRGEDVPSDFEVGHQVTEDS